MMPSSASGATSSMTMWQGFKPHKPSYDDALRGTFATTYGNSYRGVDTIHTSPVYSEREYYATPPAPDITYERESYPYSEDYQDPPARYLGERKPQTKNYYDYYNRPKEPEFRNVPPPPYSERIDRRDWPERPAESEYMKRQYNQILANPDDRHLGPVAKNACVACRGPEAQIPKCTNQLGCGHKYCDNCIRNLHATDGPFRDRQTLYYYCGICKGSRTPSPKIIRFDPYGRRIDFHVRGMQFGGCEMIAWVDKRLAWVEDECRTLNDIVVPAELLWTPDIIQYNSYDLSYSINYPDQKVVVFRNGTVWMRKPYAQKSVCNQENDSIYCTLVCGSWNHDQKRVKLKPNTMPTFITSFDDHPSLWSLTSANCTQNVFFGGVLNFTTVDYSV